MQKSMEAAVRQFGAPLVIEEVFIPGHKDVGPVVATGSGVKHLREGDRVGVPWLDENPAAFIKKGSARGALLVSAMSPKTFQHATGMVRCGSSTCRNRWNSPPTARCVRP